MKTSKENSKLEMSSELESNSTLIQTIHGQQVTRQELLILWLRRNGISFRELGRRLGVTDVSAKRICRAETAPVHRVECLLEMGIPENLLPEAQNKIVGRRPKELAVNAS